MANVPDGITLRQFHSVAGLLRHADDLRRWCCHGQWHGSILRQASGPVVFGYDPDILCARAHCSAAELSRARKKAA